MSLCREMMPTWEMKAEMERLTAENERLRAALREIAGLGVVCASDIAVVALRDARAALGGGRT